MTKEYCGDKAHENQVNYVKETKKPEDMNMDQFLKRLDSMNAALESLKEGGTNFAVEELNAQVISKALPGRIAIDYLKQGADLFTTKDEIKNVLRR